MSELQFDSDTTQWLIVNVCIRDGNSAEIQLHFITLIVNWLEESRISARVCARLHKRAISAGAYTHTHTQTPKKIEQSATFRFNFNFAPWLFMRQRNAYAGGKIMSASHTAIK